MASNNSWNGQIIQPSAFTPVLAFGGASTGITYSTQTGTYYRIGKMVIWSANIALTSKGSSTGSATITGLPIVATQTTPMNMEYSSLTYTGNDVTLNMAASSATLALFIEQSGSALTALSDAAFANTSGLNISGIYLVA